jgi:hypothetical protein
VNTFNGRSLGVVCLVASHLLTCVPMNAGILWWRQPEQEDIAAVHVGIQSVAPFEDYLDALQPKFSITADKAIEDAIAQTRAHDSSTFAAILASLSVRFPEITDVLTQTTTSDGTTAATESTRTVSDGPGALADASAPAALTRTLSATLPATTTAIDPILKYRTAGALMQEVALLSTFVRDAAISSHSKPYVVRLLVTMFPTNSSRAYDAYTTVSFFTKDRATENMLAPVQVRRAATEIGAAGNTLILSLNSRVLSNASATNCDRRPLEVVPLFVTDNIESSLHSDSLERVRDVALAVQGIWGNTRAGGGFRSQRDDLSKTLVRNLNSLMTVARLHDNTLQIRLGAMYGNRTDTMVPRTFNVTALVLFPTAKPQEELDDAGRLVRDMVASDVLPCSQALYTAQTTLRNSRSGRVASVDRGNRMARRLQALTGKDLPAQTLLDHAEAGDFEKFKSVAGVGAAQLWPQALSIVHSTSLTSGTFEAPARDMEFFSSDSHASLIDDGKAARVTLTGAVNVLPARLSSTIRVITKKEKRDLYLSATDISVGADGRSATFTFPSVKKVIKDDVGSVFIVVRYGAGPRDWQSRPYSNVWFPMELPKADGRATNDTRASLNSTSTPDDSPSFGGGSLPIAYFAIPDEPKEEKPDAEFTATASAKVIMASKGNGNATIALKHTKENAVFPMYIGVTGADIAVVAPPLDRNGVELSTRVDGPYKLALENLVVGSTVTIKTWRIDNKGTKDQKVIPGSEIAFEVRPK